eukprot:355053-Chlamydomonas_euryale.AAC.4
MPHTVHDPYHLLARVWGCGVTRCRDTRRAVNRWQTDGASAYEPYRQLLGPKSIAMCPLCT